MLSPGARANTTITAAFLSVAWLACSGAGAQRNMNPETYYKAPSTMHGKTVVIPTGTTLEGRIDSTIGSAVSQPGERFTITMSSPVLANGTDVIIPSGSQIMGEVVEAIPHTKLTKIKGGPKPTGKLRVQLTGLRTPDGMTYPMVCSLTGETIMMGRKVMANPGLGGGVGYMGSSTSFEAVAPGMADRYRGRGGRGPQVMTAQQMMRDPIFGAQQQMNSMLRSGMVKPTIRALVRRNQELFIDEGAPLSVRLDAPFKIGINPTGAAGAAMPDLEIGEQDFDNDTVGGGRRFARQARGASQQPQGGVGQPVVNPGVGQDLAIPGEDEPPAGGSRAPAASGQAPPAEPSQTPPGQDF